MIVSDELPRFFGLLWDPYGDRISDQSLRKKLQDDTPMQFENLRLVDHTPSAAPSLRPRR